MKHHKVATIAHLPPTADDAVIWAFFPANTDGANASEEMQMNRGKLEQMDPKEHVPVKRVAQYISPVLIIEEGRCPRNCFHGS